MLNNHNYLNFQDENLADTKRVITFALNMLPPLPVEQRAQGELSTFMLWHKSLITSPF